MSHLKNKSALFSLTLLLGLYSFQAAAPSIAHTVKTSGDVAATFHLEPSHNPKAGEPSTVWFALTKAGGEIIPLQDCDCKLVIERSEKRIAEPVLKPINIEQYQGIPGSEIVFPAVGIYNLEISGKPKNGNRFDSFELSYEVTVQPGKAPAPNAATVSTQPDNNPKKASINNPIASLNWIIGGTIGLLTLGGLTLIKRNR